MPTASVWPFLSKLGQKLSGLNEKTTILHSVQGKRGDAWVVQKHALRTRLLRENCLIKFFTFLFIITSSLSWQNVNYFRFFFVPKLSSALMNCFPPPPSMTLTNRRLKVTDTVEQRWMGHQWSIEQQNSWPASKFISPTLFGVAIA
jgi:hypothetical protein